MSSDDLEGPEIDRLIQELSAPPRKPAPVKPPVPGAQPVAPVAAPSVRPFGTGPLEPIAPNSTLKPRRSFISRISLPPLPRFPRVRVGPPSGPATVRLSLGLGVLLCSAMPFWPYPKGCSWWLLFYLFAVAVVVIAGVWAARLTWGARLGIAHMLALGIVFWGITLAAEETLPRIGYAKAEAHWWCPT